MHYLAAFLISLLVALILIPVLRRWAVHLDFVDKPRPDNERKLHREPIPLMAGIALFAGFAVPYILFNDMRFGEAAAVLGGSLLILAVARGAETRVWERGVGPDGTPALIESGPSDSSDTGVTAYWRRRVQRDPDLWVIELDIAGGERFAAETIASD